MTRADIYLATLAAPGTRANYGHVLRALEAFTGTPPEHCTLEQVAAYRASLTAQDRAPSTIRLHLAALSSFYTFAQLAGWRTDHPVIGMKRPRVDRRRTMHGPSADEMLRAIEEAPDARMVAMMWCLAHGVRRAELVGLNVEDVGADHLRVHGKRSRTRRVDLEPEAAAAVQRYIGDRRQGALFTGPNGRLSARTVARLVAAAGARVGIRGLRPHAMRHAYASSLAESGSNAFVIQRALGHADIRVSEIYVDLHEQAVADELRRKPLAARARATRLHVIDGTGATPLPSKDNAGSGPGGQDSRADVALP